MNRLSRIIRSANWKYAVGEVALIFVGITLALLANSWYENSQDRAEEKEILGQVLASLQTDIEAYKRNREAIAAKIRVMTDLEEHLEQGLPYDPHLDEAFRTVIMVEGVQMNTAPFETLTYRGLDLVSDANLRNLLVDYYDTEKDRLNRRNEFDFTDAMSAEPFFKKNFRWHSDKLTMTPIDYESLSSDQEFRNILAVRIWAHKTLTATEYARIGEKAAILAQSVENHLDKL